jgi:hypothetical protein
MNALLEWGAEVDLGAKWGDGVDVGAGEGDGVGAGVCLGYGARVEAGDGMMLE